MKKLFFLTLFIFMLSIISFAQHHRNNPHAFERPIKDIKTEWYPSNDLNYDVHFYHIDVEIAVDSMYIIGQVKFLISSNIEGLNSLLVDLAQNLEVTSISAPVSSYTFEENILQLELENSYNTGDTLSFTISYEGVPQMPGGYKGLRYETHDGGEPIIATLSTPYLAHSWWPCKDGTADKSDSLYVDITVKDTLIGGIPLLALSNGLLTNTTSDGVMKTFEWKHYYPIVPYYVMAAISNYQHFQQLIEIEDYSFPIDYYVFESHMEAAQEGVMEMPAAMTFYSEIFGPYPFRDEKYGMTQLGYYGAIENQTNTITNNMTANWIDISVHELAHQWFADMITCEDWHHGWVNEGFASYAEALYFEHRDGFEAYQNYVNQFKFKQGGTLYLEDVSDPFSGVFRPIIYDKGAYVLHMLRGVLGDEVFFEAIYQYATHEDLIYDLANTEDFQAVCELVSGEDLEYFFEQWIYDAYYPKYRYNFISSSSQTEVIIQQSQGVLGWRALFSMPIELYFEFEDGSDTLLKVFNNEMEDHFAFNFDQEVIGMEMDPNSWVLSDITYDPNITVGVPHIKDKSFSLYPNPSDGDFMIQLKEASFSNEDYLHLYDINGKEVYDQKINSSSLHIEGLKKGVYLLKLSIGSEVFNEKLIVY